MSQSYYYGTGRRKEAVARVRLMEGNGQVIINGQDLKDRFPRLIWQELILAPLRLTNTIDRFTAIVKVAGGGVTGQAGAIGHGIARALVQANAEFRPLLRKAGLLTRDPRVKELKKYGLKRARQRPQYTKR